MVQKPKAPYTNRSAGEEGFINEYTRKLLVQWCDFQVRTGRLAFDDPERVIWKPYVEYAQAKGWLSKDGTKILAPGWKTAAAFLRR